MTARIRAPRGTYDLVPPRSDAFLAVVDGLSAPARRSGYGYVQTPTFEDTALFVRGVGESSDVVSKEMYTFTDKGGRSLSLRPEGTAGVLRAVVEHGLYRGQLPLKLWYVGPNFRYEAPQSGRYRQHTQVGIEAIGVDDPLLDAEVVWIAWAGYRGLGLRDFSLLLNSLGCRECRPAYRTLLQDFLRGLDLDEETRRRAEINPLRVLDDKRPQMQEKLAGAPLMADHLCAACKEYHDTVRTTLADLGVAWTDAPRLVRGLDYYTRTTFEIQHNRLGAQAAVGGGGRYDGLLATLGGPDLGGIGFGLGVDRTMLALDEEGVTLPLPRSCDVYAVPLGDAARRRLIGLVTELRDAGIAADFAYGERGLKGAMRAADRSGARLALLLGDRDLAQSSVQLKDLQTGDQEAIALESVLDTVKERLS